MVSRRRAVFACGIALALAAGAPFASACNTPVFRYAMYNWAPGPFGVFYFYRGSVAKEDQPVHRKLEKLNEGEGALANVMLLSIDVGKSQELDRVPTPVKESWQSGHKGETPIYLVWGPWGQEIFAGRLDAAAVDAMVDSPVRTKIGELLKQGNAAVLLLLACAAEKENQRAEAAIKEVIQRGSRGMIPVAGVPEEPLDDGREADASDKPADLDKNAAGANRLPLAQIRISRTDPKEAWLVRMLMAVESDLAEHAKEPMVFGVYGRGRAMEPFVGAGITADNLTELAAFLAGACSCQVKERNPGVDLLFHWDWNATADALAATDPTQADRQPMYQEVSVETKPAKQPEPSEPEAAKGKLEAVEPAGSIKDTSPPSQPASTVPAVSPKTSGGPPQTSPAGEQPAPPYAVRQFWQLAVGFGLITVLVVVTGLIVMRRNSP